MADVKYYFMYHLDIYQDKNKANIDIHQTVTKKVYLKNVQQMSL